MKFRIVWVGSNADTEYRAAIERYFNRIKHFFPIEVIPVAPEKGGRNRQEIIRAESARLIKAIPTRGTTVVVDERGVVWSSLKLAKWLEEVMGRQPHGITFVIGGDNGMDQSVRDAADVVLSLSSMTLPHELARVVLLEQIYRACTLIRNVTYHK